MNWRRVVPVSLAFLVLIVAGSSQVSSATGIDLNGKDLVDGGTTIWDASNGYVPSAQIEDVYVKNTGDKITGNLNMSNNDLDFVQNIGSGPGVGSIQFTSSDSTRLQAGGDLDLVSDSDGSNGGAFTWTLASDGDLGAGGDLEMSADDITSTVGLDFVADKGGSNYKCTISDSDGSWTCDGTKSWRHSLNSSYNAVYSSQESPKVRAVFEGKSHVENSKKVELPSHFSKTVSDTEPMLRAQVTPQGTLTDAAVMDKTDDYIKIKVGKETDVNFRITGIREGYEDKQVVREKN